MRKGISLQKNFIMNAFLSVSTVIFPMITFPYASRILQPAGMGKVSLAYSLISYFLMFARLGIPTYGVRICAKVRDNKEELSRTVQELVIINLVTCAISYVVLFGAVAFIPRLNGEKELYLSMSVLIFLGVIGVEWLFKAMEEYSYITTRSIIFKIIAVIAMFLLVNTESDYVIYGGTCIFAACASNLSNLFLARRYVTMKPVGNYCFKRHLKAISIFFATACATTIATHLDTIMLGFMSTDVSVGYYNTAVKIKIILVNVVTSLGAVLLPRASYCVEHGLMEEFRTNCKKALNFVFLLAPALVIYFMVYAKQGILLLSGEAYINSVLPMRIIMPTLLLVGITNVLGVQTLIPLGREKVVLRSVVTGAIVNVILNALLIPRFAETGAAIGTLIAETVVFVVQYCALREQISGMLREIQYGKIALALFGGVVASWWVLYLPIYNWAVLVISACLFFGVYCVVLILMKETLAKEVIEQMLGLISLKGKTIHENIAN